jgi:hypothetical protein
VKKAPTEQGRHIKDFPVTVGSAGGTTLRWMYNFCLFHVQGPDCYHAAGHFVGKGVIEAHRFVMMHGISRCLRCCPSQVQVFTSSL